MFRLWYLSLGALLVVGCSSSHATPAPTQCKQSDRSGVYRITFTEQGGNCGPLPPTLANFSAPNAGAPSSTGCRSLAPDAWSDGDCKLARTLECTSTDAVTTATAVTRQETANGSELSGDYTVAIRLKSGDSCNSTYTIDAIRE